MKDTKSGYINSVNLNTTSDFPYLVLDVINENSFPRNPGFQVMHWHEDLQFIYILDGNIQVKTLEGTFHAEKGSGIFINKNIIHLVEKSDSCHYKSSVFPDFFLKFYLGSPAKSFVENITEEKNISVCKFSAEDSRCSEILSLLSELSELKNKKTEFYVYEVFCLLSKLWLEFCKNIKPTKKNVKNKTENRMMKFLRHINEHYGEEISLEELAKSANVSKSECLRCFKTSLRTTPYKYLMEFRLAKAAELLKNSDEPIGIIADKTGFQQISHFGKCSKEKTRLSPRDFRKNK